jgi:hypothetical protein
LFRVSIFKTRFRYCLGHGLRAIPQGPCQSFQFAKKRIRRIRRRNNANALGRMCRDGGSDRASAAAKRVTLQNAREHRRFLAGFNNFAANPCKWPVRVGKQLTNCRWNGVMEESGKETRGIIRLDCRLLGLLIA